MQPQELTVSRMGSISLFLSSSVFHPYLSYPLYPNATSPVALERYYARQSIVTQDFFGDIVRANQYELVRMWQIALGNRRNPDIWEMYADSECFSCVEG